jgi:hypothetical protein
VNGVSSSVYGWSIIVEQAEEKACMCVAFSGGEKMAAGQGLQASSKRRVDFRREDRERLARADAGGTRNRLAMYRHVCTVRRPYPGQ